MQHIICLSIKKDQHFIFISFRFFFNFLLVKYEKSLRILVIFKRKCVSFNSDLFVYGAAEVNYTINFKVYGKNIKNILLYWEKI